MKAVDCWLLEQQGLDHLQDGFLKYEITEAKLTDTDNFFTEEFVRDSLGVENKIVCKKSIMAAKRLQKAREEFPNGTEFDSNDSYSFTLVGSTTSSSTKRKVIQGMELGVSSMKPGEVAKLKIRSDYAYGPEGYRKSNGDVMIPPFATLLFEITLQ